MPGMGSSGKPADRFDRLGAGASLLHMGRCKQREICAAATATPVQSACGAPPGPPIVFHAVSNNGQNRDGIAGRD
jgi:hypothetical protein